MIVLDIHLVALFGSEAAETPPRRRSITGNSSEIPLVVGGRETGEGFSLKGHLPKIPAFVK